MGPARAVAGRSLDGRSREGLGLGDVKVVAMIGAFLGLQGAMMTVLLGSLLGSVIGIACIVVTGKNMSACVLPFGAFLGIAALGARFRRRARESGARARRPCSCRNREGRT
jgi:prepilin signal peptidase PulO-like enzyme (type II secretory pathway)